MSDKMESNWQDGYEWGLEEALVNSNRALDDLRFAVWAIKSGDGEQAIFSLCRALGDATEAAEVVRNEWRRL